MQFHRNIGAFGILFTGIGSIVGSGWLFGPLYVAQIAGPAAILSWIIGGLLMVIIAFTFAELGSTFPVAGGLVQYANYSHGPLVSFMTGWMVWISSVAVAPVETLGLIQYSANYIPQLVTKIDNTTVLTHEGMLVAAIVMFLMCILNYQGAKFFSRASTTVTIIKLIVPLLTIFVLIVADFHSTNFHDAAPGGFSPYGLHGILAALPLGGVIYSFIGSNTVLLLAGETKNPQKNIPLALIGSVLFCIILYVLIQTAFIGALDPHLLTQGWKNLQYPGDSGPFVGILTAFGLTWFVIILYADAIISPFGTGFIYTAATARVCYGLSKIGFFPQLFQKITERGVPIRGLILNYFIGLLLFLPFPGWQSLVGFIISCFIISYIIGPIALIGLRKTKPDLHRPFRLPCATLFTLIAFYICNLMVFWTGWKTVFPMMIAMLVGLVFFVIYSIQQGNGVWKKQMRTGWWLFPYLIGMTILSYFGTFGHGRGNLSFGVDFIAVAVLTIVIFYLAVKLSENQDLQNNTLDLLSEKKEVN